MGYAVSRFNSKVVRLKAGHYYQAQIIKVFQFQSGAVKSLYRRA